MSIEVGGHFDDPLWQGFWDFVFCVSNVLLAVLFGAAFGNLVRGAPLAKDGSFHLPFFTDFTTRGEVGLLDWYTLSVAAFALLVLTAHGATYLAMRTRGPVYDRSRALAKKLWLAAIPGFVIISAQTFFVRPELLIQLPSRPVAWVALILSLGSATALGLGLRSNREKLAMAGATFLIFGLILTGAAALFPVLLFSTLEPGDALTAAACAAPDHSLRVAAAWWFPSLALAFTYLWLVQRKYAGKVDLAEDNQGLY
jgi:cytochrome d ubiquinol oxidase subunit II